MWLLRSQPKKYRKESIADNARFMALYTCLKVRKGTTKDWEEYIKFSVSPQSRPSISGSLGHVLGLPEPHADIEVKMKVSGDY